MTNNTSNEEIEIDLLELSLELLKHWKGIVASTFLMGLIAFSFSLFFITPKFESTSELYVLSKSTSITSLTDIQMGTNLTNDYIVVVAGRPVLEQVIKNLSLEEDYEELGEMITLNNPSNSRILEITVTDTDPARAKEIADELAEVSAAFISEKMDQDPPSIIQYGYVNEKPVSPSILKNSILGALIGLLLAAILVTISYLTNDRITTADEIEKKLGLNFLGSLPLEEETEFNGFDGKEKKGA